MPYVLLDDSLTESELADANDEIREVNANDA
jgi:hypothetical protein